MGATLTLDTPGVYIITGVFNMDGDSLDGFLIGELDIDGAVQSGEAQSHGSVRRVNTTQVWLLAKTTLGPTIIKLTARKTDGSGTSSVLIGLTTIMAFTVPGSQDLTALT